MADFINTIDVLGDDAAFDSIINGTITEFKDDTVTQVGGYTFFNCTALKSVSLPNCKGIGDNAFMNTAIVTADFPKLEGASNGANIFSGCKSLKSASFPLATEIPSANFDACTALETVSYPLAAVVKSNAFKGCTGLKMLDFPAVTQIKGEAFSGCSSLKTFVLRSQTVCSLDSVYAFRSTPIYNGTGYIHVPTALYDSYLADSKWSTYADQFRKLEEWTVDGTVTGELDMNRHMVRFFDEDGTLLYYVIVPTESDAVYIGDDPVKEGDYAFTGWNPSPTNVTADMDCYAQFRSTAIVSKKLVERTISGDYANDRVETVGSYAFYYCTALETANFPVATSIGDSAFNGCTALTTADFPVVTSIGIYAFQSCSKLTTLILRNTNGVVKLSSTNAFTSTPIASGTGYIYVPKTMADGSDGVEAYKAASNWSNFGNQIRAIEDYPEIYGGEA